jgi:hypothetical protein
LSDGGPPGLRSTDQWAALTHLRASAIACGRCRYWARALSDQVEADLWWVSLFWQSWLEEVPDDSPRCFAQQGDQFGKHDLDWVQVRRIWRRIQPGRAGSLDCRFDTGQFVNRGATAGRLAVLATTPMCVIYDKSRATAHTGGFQSRTDGQ